MGSAGIESEDRKMTELERFPIEALVALVDRETVVLRSDFHKYGEIQFDPLTPALKELNNRLEKAMTAKETK